MISKIARHKMIWIAISLSLIYWIMAAIAPVDITLESLNWILVATATVVTIAYAPVAIGAVASGRPDRVEQLVLGIVCSWGATIAMRTWSGVWRFLDQPDWMASSRIFGFFIYISILGGVLHITAPGAADGVIPRKNWVMLGLAIGSGALIAGFFIGAKWGRMLID